MTFAERLKGLRIAKGLSQEELGRLANVTSVTICNYEGGKIKPSVNTQIQLAKVLGIKREELMNEEPGK